MHALRPLTLADHAALVGVYRDAVCSQAAGLYTPAQVAAWAGLPARSGALEQALRDGFGLASTDGTGAGAGAGDPIEAFGILDPPDRLALLYCRGRSCRQGRSSAILTALEHHATLQGIPRLRTEASQLSRPLLSRRGWRVENEERVLFAGEWFERWRMIKDLHTP